MNKTFLCFISETTAAASSYWNRVKYIFNIKYEMKNDLIGVCVYLITIDMYH